jgi:hypothetical protein
VGAVRLSDLTLVILVFACVGCSRPQPTGPATQPGEPLVSNVVVNRIWKVSGPADVAPGSIYTFLSDGTLMMTSCVETYRLARWTRGPGERLTIQEDPSVSYEASVTPRGTDRLSLVLHLKTEQVERTLEPAVVPAVCPDLRR